MTVRQPDSDADAVADADAGPAAAARVQARWALAFARGLRRAGVREVIASPGSRSTPLLFACARAGLRITPIIDERAAAFFALGQARVTGVPCALVCTSGTAGAHYYPAVIEAAAARVPLIAITADRPPELHGCGANQTIDQTRLFGVHVRAAIDLGPPTAGALAHRAVARKAAQAVLASLSPEPGPVHVNAPARAPLEPPCPVGEHGDDDQEDDGDGAARMIRAIAGRLEVPDAALDELAAACARHRRGIVACGPMPAHWSGVADAVARFSRAAGFPVVAEATSGARLSGLADRGPACDGFEWLFGSRTFADAAWCELIVAVGAPLTARSWAGYSAGAARHIAIAPWGWSDPDSRVDVHVAGDPARALAQVAARLEAAPPAPDRAWLALFAAGERAAWRCVDDHLSGVRTAGAMREADAVRAAVAAASAGGAALALGNSLTVRHADMYCRGGDRAVAVLSQRGASGIDGNVAAAAGAASAGASGAGPVVLIVGDVGFCHDISGLAAARHALRPLAIVVIDNRGGRIFDQLPVARAAAPESFTDRWLTPPAIDIEAAARVFGHSFARAESAAALGGAVREAIAPGGARCAVIQAVVDPASAAADRDAIARAVDAAMADVVRDSLGGGDAGRAARAAR